MHLRFPIWHKVVEGRDEGRNERGEELRKAIKTRILMDNQRKPVEKEKL